MSEDNNTDEKTRNEQVWMLLALMYGYNELAKTQKTLGDKLFCRLAREECVKNLEALGCVIKREDVDIVLTIPRLPKVNFNKEDIELMRACVAEWDSKVLDELAAEAQKHNLGY